MTEIKKAHDKFIRDLMSRKAVGAGRHARGSYRVSVEHAQMLACFKGR